MKTIVYHSTDNKLDEFGDGPWMEEPDKMQWQDEDTGLPCLIVRNQFGTLCGYVGVPQGHPMHSKHYDDGPDLRVHGGLTFAGSCSHGEESKSICHVPEPGEPDDVWWLGFDAGHAFDYSPGMAKYSRDQGRDFFDNDQFTYRNFGYMRNECAKLAKQLKEFKTCEAGK